MPDWIWQHPESTPRKVMLSPLILAEGLYRVGAWWGRTKYAWRLRKPTHLQARVISIGNLTVGGSCKTPMTAWIAKELRNRGMKVAILSRGYRGHRTHEVNVVSDGERVLLSPAEVGDEAVWLAGAVPGVQVLAGMNRVALGLRATSVFGAEVLLLDDGFQHHRVHRDINLLCVDGAGGFFNHHTLPRGPLREPIHTAERADAVLWTRVPEKPELHDDAALLPLGIPQFRIEVKPLGIRKLGSRQQEDLQRLRGTTIGVLTAIARPDRFCEDLRRLGATISEVRSYADHHAYERSDIQGLSSDRLWITTAKDAIKLPSIWASGRRVYVLEEEVRPEDPVAFLEWMLSRFSSGGSKR